MGSKKPFANFSQAYDYLTRAVDYEKTSESRYTRAIFDLKRVRKTLRKLGNPDKKIEIIHIAGTKGKGSTAFMIASILGEAGYRTGKFISPHLIKINERISINQSEITDREFTQLMNVLYPYVEEAKAGGKSLTFFDIITIGALTYFCHQTVDFAVLETGVGGRLDSTNVVDPAACVITSIGFDHMDKLGDSLEKIAYEKAGIIKEKVPIISGVTNTEAKETIKRVAISKNAPIFQIKKDFSSVFSPRTSTFQVKTKRRTYPGLSLPLLGEHQRDNAAVAVATLDSLYERRLVSFSLQDAKNGLAKAYIPGRIEVINKEPTVVLDVAHNPSSLSVLSQVLEEQFPTKRKVFLFGMLRDKDIKGCLKMLLPQASEIGFTSADSPRSETPENLAKVTRELGFRDYFVEPDIERAFKLALERIGVDGLLCITGSTYLAGKVASLKRE